MALSDILVEFVKPWLQYGVDAERKRELQVRQGIDEINARKSDIFARMKKLEPLKDLIYLWQEQYDYQNILTGKCVSGTITFDGYIRGAAVNSTNMKIHIRPNNILRRVNDGTLVEVTAVDYTALTADVSATGSHSSISDDAAIGTEYYIVGYRGSDLDEGHQPKALDTSMREVGSQIFSETFLIPHTWRRVPLRNIADKAARDIKKITEKMRLDIAISLLQGEPVYSGGVPVYGNKVEDPMLCGLCHWPEVVHVEKPKTYTRINKSGTQITTTDLDDMVYNLQVHEGINPSESGWSICCHPIQMKYISRFDREYRIKPWNDTKSGTTIKSFECRTGEVLPIVSDWHMPPDIILVLNINDMGWGYCQGDDIWTKDLPTQSRTDMTMITCQPWGSRPKLPRQIGKFYGLPTS